MKGKSKRKFTPEFKLKVVLAVLKEKDTLATGLATVHWEFFQAAIGAM